MTEPVRHIKMWVTKRFGHKTVLDNFNLEVQGNEFVTFLGPSGSGKSTALNCIAGLIPLTEGEIWVNERRLDTLPPERRGLGMVFQNYALFPHITVFKNIAFGLELRHVPDKEIRQRVAEMICLVQLDGFEDRYPSQLSGGQQQRVAIARALVVRPSLLLLDEPLSNLDAKLRVEMRGEIKRFHEELGLTSVYVTHDQSEALSLSDRIVLLNNGITQQVGSPKQLFNEPANLFVADFMGFKNFFPCRVSMADGAEGTVVERKGLRLAVQSHAKPSVGAEVTAAIRPDDVQLVPHSEGVVGDGPVNRYRGEVKLAEYLGKESDLQVDCEGLGKVTVRTPEEVSVGDWVELFLDPKRIILLESGPQAVR